MEVEKYVKLVEGTKDGLDRLIILLKTNGASEGEAIFALMKGLHMPLSNARKVIIKSKLWNSDDQLNDSMLELFNE